MVSRKRVYAALLLLVVMVWCVPAGRADEVTFWNSIALDIMRESMTHPPRVGRDLAIVHSSIYDALNAIDRMHTPLFYQPSLAGPASREAAVAAAAHEALVGLYPTYETSLNGLFNARLAAIPDGRARDTGIALGRSVADNMLTLRASDGWNAGSVYEGGTKPGQWRPTPPGFQPALAPHWGNVKPFAIPGVEEFRPGPPPALGSHEYAVALNETKLLGASDSTVRTPDQTQIAEFWNDYPGLTAAPAGKWNLIAQTLGEQQGNTLAQNARMLALLNVSLADVGIVCWDTKYTYGLWRPEDAIRLADTDGNPGTLADPDWTPLWPSPAFPEYNSGHSSFSGASAETTISHLTQGRASTSCPASRGTMTAFPRRPWRRAAVASTAAFISSSRTLRAWSAGEPSPSMCTPTLRRRCLLRAVQPLFSSASRVCHEPGGPFFIVQSDRSRGPRTAAWAGPTKVLLRSWCLPGSLEPGTWLLRPKKIRKISSRPL